VFTPYSFNYVDYTWENEDGSWTFEYAHAPPVIGYLTGDGWLLSFDCTPPSDGESCSALAVYDSGGYGYLSPPAQPVTTSIRVDLMLVVGGSIIPSHQTFTMDCTAVTNTQIYRFHVVASG
jgi:hypothetical protein